MDERQLDFLKPSVQVLATIYALFISARLVVFMMTDHMIGHDAQAMRWKRKNTYGKLSRKYT